MSVGVFFKNKDEFYVGYSDKLKFFKTKNINKISSDTIWFTEKPTSFNHFKLDNYLISYEDIINYFGLESSDIKTKLRYLQATYKKIIKKSINKNVDLNDYLLKNKKLIINKKLPNESIQSIFKDLNKISYLNNTNKMNNEKKLFKFSNKKILSIISESFVVGSSWKNIPLKNIDSIVKDFDDRFVLIKARVSNLPFELKKVVDSQRYSDYNWLTVDELKFFYKIDNAEIDIEEMIEDRDSIKFKYSNILEAPEINSTFSSRVLLNNYLHLVLKNDIFISNHIILNYEMEYFKTALELVEKGIPVLKTSKNGIVFIVNENKEKIINDFCKKESAFCLINNNKYIEGEF
jgi:hypothetical protein